MKIFRCEVFVMGIVDLLSHLTLIIPLLLDQSREKSKKDPGDSFQVLVHRAASAASKLAKHAYESASANKRMDDELVPLKCCLMSVSLPWDYIAHDLLHKVRSLHYVSQKISILCLFFFILVFLCIPL
jgi:hypothetical protein